MLEKDFQYFLNNQDELFSKYPNKFSVIEDEPVVAAFDTNIEAYSYGVENYGLGSFLIQRALADELAYTASIA